MILADYQAISHGLSSIAQARDNAEQMALHQAALKRQMERDASDEELRRAAMKIQEQQAAEATADRRAAMKIQEQQAAEATADRRERLTADQQRLKMQLDQQAWSFSPENPANRLHSAQVAHLGAQTAALATKPQTPLGATTQGIDEFSAAMADAQEENAQALAFAQANPQHPEAGRRLAKAQLKLAGLQEFSKTMLQKWKPETDHTIDLELPGAPGADGVPEGKLRMKVPISQWNESHPLWQRFNPAKPTIGAPSAASSYIANALGRPAPTAKSAAPTPAAPAPATPAATPPAPAIAPAPVAPPPPNTINSVNQWVQADTQNKAIARRKVELQTALAEVEDAMKGTMHWNGSRAPQPAEKSAQLAAQRTALLRELAALP